MTAPTLSILPQSIEASPSIDTGIATHTTQERGAVFAIATRVFIYFIVTVALFIGVTPISSLALSFTLIVLLAISGKRSMTVGFAVFYAILFAIYVGMFIAGLHIFVFSPPRILQMIGAMPTMVAFFFIVTAPPGLISAALAKMRLPKKIIVGVLVIIRFFPTVSAFWRKYRDAVRTRGLLTVTSVITNPMTALEYVVVPVMLSLATSADRLSTSAIARAAEAPTRRTSYYAQPVGTRDVLAILAVILVAAGCVWSAKAGLV